MSIIDFEQRKVNVKGKEHNLIIPVDFFTRKEVDVMPKTRSRENKTSYRGCKKDPSTGMLIVN